MTGSKIFLRFQVFKISLRNFISSQEMTEKANILHLQGDKPVVLVIQEEQVESNIWMQVR